MLIFLIVFGGGLLLLTGYYTYNLKPVSNNDTLKNTGDETRTVMVYMVGSNLETQLALGSQDFEGISKNLDFTKLKVVFIAALKFGLIKR